MKLDRFIRLAAALAIVAVFIIAVGALLFVTESALNVWDRLREGPVGCVFVDEAQFLSKDQVWQLACAVDDLNVPVMCYGIRVDFQGELFPGSAALLAWADEMREVRTIDPSGKKATMVIRKDADGNVVKSGDQVQVGGNETYVSLSRRGWREAMGDKPRNSKT